MSEPHVSNQNRRRDAVLRRMLATPPAPQDEKPGRLGNVAAERGSAPPSLLLLMGLKTVRECQQIIRLKTVRSRLEIFTPIALHYDDPN